MSVLLTQESKWCNHCKDYHPLTNENWLSISNTSKLRCRIRERLRTRKWRALNRDKVRIGNYTQKKKPSTRFSELRSNAFNRNLEVTIDLELFTKLINQSCTYCDSPESVGIDRVDNSMGYTPSNCISCCYTCNITRNNLYSYEEFKQYLVPGIKAIRNARQSESNCNSPK